MDVNQALRQRKSTRAFLDKPVEAEKLERILDAARHAPSGTNTQPWQVAVVRGESKKKLETALETAFRAGETKAMDFEYYPVEWIEPFKSRRKACGLQMYSTLDIKREDKARQLDQWAANYRAFDAPVMMLFFIDKIMETGSYLDYGLFLQSVMLMAEEEGLATCPQASLGEYPVIVKEQLGYEPDSVLVCGLALGYEEKEALVNNYRTPREEIVSFTRYFD